ncbi:META domain-containing protein [Candidatus Binatia bacterium]|jgi:heat shock protein HslJ|nr:META domain-containing protein [Candidatus Binatia bacterium]
MRTCLLAITAAAMLVATGCSMSKPTEPPAPPATKAALEGKTWRLQSLGGIEPAKLAAVQGGVTLRFAGNAVQASAGCNQMRGTYTLDDGVLEASKMAGTMMACPEPAMSIENAVKKALSVPLRATLSGGRLTLRPEDADDGPTMVLAPEMPPQIEGAWNVNGVSDGRKALMSTLRGTSLSLSFAGGTVSGSAGCNTFRGAYKVQGDRVAIGRLSTTRKACPGDGVMKQESNFVAALEKAETWKIESGELTLRGADGERLVSAVAAGNRS